MTHQEELQERLNEQLFYAEGKELYCKTTLHNVIAIAMKMAFTRGVDFVYYGNPFNNGDKTDYEGLKRYLETSNCFTELTASDIDFFLKSLKEAHE